MSRLGIVLQLVLAIILQVLQAKATSGTIHQCGYSIVESMPEKMVFEKEISLKPQPTHECLLELIESSTKTLDIASFYWILNPPEPDFATHPSSLPGRSIMDAITKAAKRGVKVQVLLDANFPSNRDDVKLLEQLGTVRYLNMTKLLKAGVMHSKFLIADNKSLYVGSSNFDWRSYTQIKEIGIKLTDCSVVAEDLSKIFQTYVFFSDQDHVPQELPSELTTKINLDSPVEISFANQFNGTLFLGAAPPAFNGLGKWVGRTDDSDGLVHLINEAKHSIDISVMNYSPRTEFIWPKKYWPKIDEALRRAASERRVRVRLMFSNWTHAKPEELMWYRSLNAVQSPTLKGGGIQVRMFKVPAFDRFQERIPFARVKHDKYLVTERAVFIGTSNWAPDYFINTCGLSVVIRPKDQSKNNMLVQMQEIFERDFTSEFAHDLSQIANDIH